MSIELLVYYGKADLWVITEDHFLTLSLLFCGAMSSYVIRTSCVTSISFSTTTKRCTNASLISLRYNITFYKWIIKRSSKNSFFVLMFCHLICSKTVEAI